MDNLNIRPLNKCRFNRTYYKPTTYRQAIDKPLDNLGPQEGGKIHEYIAAKNYILIVA